MSDREETSTTKPGRQSAGAVSSVLNRRLLQARFSLIWEAIWPAVWPPLGIAGLFAGVALLDGFSYLPGWLHAISLAIAAGLFGFALYTGIRPLVLPNRRDAVRRIEQATDLDHRPLEALQDTLPDEMSDPTSRALWEAHQRQMAARIGSLKVGAPSPGLPARDPWALRAVVVLLLFVGVVVAGPDAGDRLERSMVPSFGDRAASQTAKLEIWVTPPDYTGLPPIFPVQIARDHAKAIERTAANAGENGSVAPEAAELEIKVPEGSVLTAIVSGGSGDAVIEIDGAQTPFEALDRVNQKLQQPLATSGRLSVIHDGKVLGTWKLRAKADTAPEIAFDGTPAATKRGTLRMAYTGSDDYGITEIRGEMRRTYERGEVIGKEVSRFELPAPTVNVRKVKEATFQEIAPHPWAGLPVVMRLAAKDAKGQESFSEEIKMVLPERTFNNPVAKEIIVERQRLTIQPERRGEIIDRLNEIASDTGAFKDDTVVFLGLVLSRSRLFHEERDTAISPVRNLLWDTALRVEDGQLSHAERELARAQEELMKALARNASDRELERLMSELQNAMNRFMRELAKKMQNSPNAQQAMSFDPTARILQSSDLQKMLEQIRNLMRAGARDVARQMLSQLRNMMESLRNARIMRANPNTQRGNQAFRQLQEMIRRQNELMDKTFRQSQGRPGSQQNMQQGEQQQRALREMLKKFQQMMKGIMPGNSKGMRPLGQAGRAMEGAAKSLGQSQPGEAVGQQGQALEALRRAGRSMMQQMMNRFARRSGIGMGQQFNPLNSMRDPLGRDWQDEEGSFDTRRVTIPDEGSVERAQEILDELRKRAGQGFRTPLELDYINRLLQRF